MSLLLQPLTAKESDKPVWGSCRLTLKFGSVQAPTSLGRLADIGTAAGLGRFVKATEAAIEETYLDAGIFGDSPISGSGIEVA